MKVTRVGRHKARVFRSRLGMTAIAAEALRQAIQRAAQGHREDLRPSGGDEHGQRFVLDFSMSTAAGAATIRSTWIVASGEDVLRLTSCYVL